MATTKEKEKRPKREKRHPERKWGPFAGGSGVAVFLNQFETAQGTRYARSIVLAPRRFLSKKTGELEDAGSYRPVDVPAILLALQAAHEFCVNTPLPGEAAEPEDLDSVVTNGEAEAGNVPF